MPQESLRIDELESGSLRVNRNKAEAKVVVRAASERLGLEFTSRHGDDGIVVNGTLFRHNASKLYFTFDEEPGGRATVLAPHLASGWTLGAGKLQRELVESMKSVGTNHG